MSIVLFTGRMGHGKTLNAIDYALEQYSHRQIYEYGIDGCDHDALDFKHCEDPKKWMELPQGSVLIVDEAQHVFPVRHKGDPPEYITQLTEMRHHGVAIVLVTQDPMQIDVYVRRLVDVHFHVLRGNSNESTTIYRYASIKDKPTKPGEGLAPVSKKTKRFNKDLYDKYKSAEFHDFKKRGSWKKHLLWFLPLLFIALVVFAVFFIRNLGVKAAEIEFKDGAQAEKKMLFGDNSSSSMLPGKKPSNKRDLLAHYSFMETSLVSGQPWSAPVYGEVRDPITYPKPRCMLVSAERRCVCITQQGTRLTVPYDICADIAVNGWFDRTRPDIRSDDRQERVARVDADASPPPRDVKRSRSDSYHEITIADYDSGKTVSFPTGFAASGD